jgi:hypothetical protein
MRILSWFANLRPAVPCLSKHVLLWCLCLLASLSFLISSLLSVFSAGLAFRFTSALCATLATTALQKFVVLELKVILLDRNRPACAVALEMVLSNWTESALSAVAACMNHKAIVPAFLVGGTAFNCLLVLGACFVHGGHHSSKIQYPFLMTVVHARTLPAGLALCAYTAFYDMGSKGKHPLVSAIVAILIQALSDRGQKKMALLHRRCFNAPDLRISCYLYLQYTQR